MERRIPVKYNSYFLFKILVIQNFFEKSTCMALFFCADLFGCAGSYNLSTAKPTFRTNINDPICRLYHVKIMLNNKD